METLIINADKENAKLILQLVKNLGGSGKILSKKVNKVKLREKAWDKKTDEILKDKNLPKKEKAFYKKFARAVGEAKAMKAGDIKPRPLKEVLDEI